MNLSKKTIFTSALLSLTLACCYTLIRTRIRLVPQSYMDEQFHVYQAQLYCRGNFSYWDPKITTPPGLYLLHLAILKPLQFLFDHLPITAASLSNSFVPSSTSWWCNSVLPLLLPNPFVWLAIFFVTLQLQSQLTHRYSYTSMTQQNQEAISALNAACIFANPLLAFFIPMFYTDLAGTLFALTAVKQYMSHGVITLSHQLVTFCVVCVAIFIRQTNAIWAALFPLGLAFERELTREAALHSKKKTNNDGDDDAIALGQLARLCALCVMRPHRLLMCVCRALFVQPASRPHFAALCVCTGYAILGNAGHIALGDQSAHAAQPHVAQLLYLVAFITALSPLRLVCVTLPSVWRRGLTRHFRPRCYATVCCGGAIVIAIACCIMAMIRWGTVQHAYLLADNRHYTFYLWRRILQPPLSLITGVTVMTSFAEAARLAGLLALYGVCVRHVWLQLCEGGAPLLLRLNWLVCCALCLVPAPLLELRYFILPYSMWRLLTACAPLSLSVASQSSFSSSSYTSSSNEARANTHTNSNSNRNAVLILGGEAALGAAITALTWHIFLYKPFRWPNLPADWQRFMW